MGERVYRHPVPEQPVQPGDARVACQRKFGTTLPTAIHNISDDANGGANTAVIYGTLTTEIVTDFFTSGTNTAYGYIRKINILLTSIDGGGLPQATIDKIKAQAYFLRAWTYFQLVKVYGGVPYITTPQDWITDNLNVPRNKTSECVDSMLADLSHCSVLPTTWVSPDIGRITRDAALALKGKILLYWASPQFNPGNDATRWEAAYQANEAAYDSLINHGYALYPKFGSIFLDAASTGNHEVILFRAFNGTTTTGQFEGNDAVTRPYSQSAGSGGKTNNPTWNLVRVFPMLDGRAPRRSHQLIHLRFCLLLEKPRPPFCRNDCLQWLLLGPEQHFRPQTVDLYRYHRR